MGESLSDSAEIEQDISDHNKGNLDSKENKHKSVEKLCLKLARSNEQGNNLKVSYNMSHCSESNVNYDFYMSDGELSGTRRGLKYNCEQKERHDDNGGTSKITDLLKIKEIVALNLSDAAAKI